MKRTRARRRRERTSKLRILTDGDLPPPPPSPDPSPSLLHRHHDDEQGRPDYRKERGDDGRGRGGDNGLEFVVRAQGRELQQRHGTFDCGVTVRVCVCVYVYVCVVCLTPKIVQSCFTPVRLSPSICVGVCLSVSDDTLAVLFNRDSICCCLSVCL